MTEERYSRQDFEDALMGVAIVHDMEAFAENGHMAKLFPEVQAIVGFGGEGTDHKDLWWHTTLVVHQCPNDNPLVRWAALFHDVGKPPTFSTETGKVAFHGHEALSAKLWNQAAKRTGWFTDEERKTIRFLIYNLGRIEAYYVGWTDSAIRRLSKEVGGQWDNLLALAWADSTTGREAKQNKHIQRMTSIRDRHAALMAEDAIVPALPKGLGDVLCAELGMEPGKALGDLMRALKAAVEAEELPRSGEHQVYLDWANVHARAAQP